MVLSKEQMGICENHLRAKTSVECPMCKGKAWSINPDLGFYGLLDVEYKQPKAGEVKPVLLVTCDNCYYVASYSAMELGLIK